MATALDEGSQNPIGATLPTEYGYESKEWTAVPKGEKGNDPLLHTGTSTLPPL